MLQLSYLIIFQVDPVGVFCPCITLWHMTKRTCIWKETISIQTLYSLKWISVRGRKFICCSGDLQWAPLFWFNSEGSLKIKIILPMLWQKKINKLTRGLDFIFQIFALQITPQNAVIMMQMFWVHSLWGGYNLKAHSFKKRTKNTDKKRYPSVHSSTMNKETQYNKK